MHAIFQPKKKKRSVHAIFILKILKIMECWFCDSSITCILFGAGCNKGVLMKDCDDIFLLYKTILYSF